MKNIELARCVDVFLAQYKQSTKVSYKGPLKDMLRYVGEGNSPADIHALDLLEYVGKIKSRDYAPATINKILKTVKVFFNWCKTMGFIDVSPAADIPLVRVPQKIDRNKAMQADEFDKIIEYFNVAVKYPLGHYRWRDYACFLFFVDTGCRRGGVSTLTLDRIDTIAQVATVHEKGKSRDVHFGEECARAIDKWIEERQKKGINSKWVFSTTGEQWKPACVSQMIRRTAKRAGVRTPRSSHSIRHFVAKRMADDNVNPKITQAALGHSSVDITIKHYYDTTDDEVRTEMRKRAYRPSKADKIRIFEDAKRQSS